MKPAYLIPSMKQIEEVRATNGYKVISTFSGCGGACLGFEIDGYQILYANEFVEAARDTYALNHTGVILDPRDIRTVTGEDILKQVGMSKGEIDVLEGSPPCASFSTAGSREKAWGKVKQYSDTQQRADDLFFEYTRLVGEIQPKVFTAENVSGLVKGKAIGYFKEIIREMRTHGYEVAAKVLDASYLGVPQARQRLIFVGVRQDLVDKYDVHPTFPKPLPYRYAIKEVIPIDGRVIHDTAGQFSVGDVTDRPVNTITTANSHWHIRENNSTIIVDPETGDDLRVHIKQDDDFIILKRGSKAESRSISSEDILPTIAANGLSNVNASQAGVRLPMMDDPETGEDLSVANCITHDLETGQDIRLDKYAIAPEWDKLAVGEQSTKYFQLVKPHPDKPIGTITATAGGIGAAGSTHPTQRRKFTLQELRILSSFPADFILTGSYAQRWERIGRSVPPFMARAIAETIRTEILDKTK
jgi:DNA (cytosine-5)-methyltransferase 1